MHNVQLEECSNEHRKVRSYTFGPAIDLMHIVASPFLRC